MDRRHFLAAAATTAAALATAASPIPLLAQTRPPMLTRWNILESEGYDAIAFLGALSGGALYRANYAAEADAFAPKLPPAIRDDIPRLTDEADKQGFGLLWPVLANRLSGAGITTLDSVIAVLGDLDGRVRAALQRNPSQDDKDWAWLKARAARLHAVFIAMRDAGFPAFRRERIGTAMTARIAEVSRGLAGYDVIRWQQKLTGRTFDPTITVILLYFSKPHGASMQNQTFLQAADYDIATTVRIAAHEMLHPPFAMDGPAATAAIAALDADPLFPRIAREHDPKWGYTTVKGLLNEDCCQALDQLISEALGVARNPADRWRKSDDGIHVLAAALYGMLRQDHWVETGGNFEQWIAKAVADGRFAPDVLHPVAARVLERPADHLWPLAT